MGDTYGRYFGNEGDDWLYPGAGEFDTQYFYGGGGEDTIDGWWYARQNGNLDAGG